MKKKICISGIILCMALFLVSCRTDEILEMDNRTEDKFEQSNSQEPGGAEETVESENRVNHYYNRGIYAKDGYIYRQFSDGLYRREKNTDQWEQLCEVPIKVGLGLTAYGDRLYFTCYQKEADEQKNGWNNSIYYLDLDTMEWNELLTIGPLTDAVAVYDSCLYVQYMEEGYMLYEGYRLNERGEIEEKLDVHSEDFLCYEQNQYNVAEYEMMGIQAHNYEIDKEPDVILKESKHEIISIPYCAAMLDGKVLLLQQNNESSQHVFLRDLETGEDVFLFDAERILFVTDDEIYYVTETTSAFMYYSFEDKTAREFELPESSEGEQICLDNCLTYNKTALYFYNYGRKSGSPQILSYSLENRTVKIVAEGEQLNETENRRVNQVDEEFFYHGDQIYNLP